MLTQRVPKFLIKARKRKVDEETFFGSVLFATSANESLISENLPSSSSTTTANILHVNISHLYHKQGMMVSNDATRALARDCIIERFWHHCMESMETLTIVDAGCVRDDAATTRSYSARRLVGKIEQIDDGATVRSSGASTHHEIDQIKNILPKATATDTRHFNLPSDKFITERKVGSADTISAALNLPNHRFVDEQKTASVNERKSTAVAAADATQNSALCSPMPLNYSVKWRIGNSAIRSTNSIDERLMRRLERSQTQRPVAAAQSGSFIYSPKLICVCLVCCLLFNAMGANALCESCRMSNFENYKLMRQEQILNELLMKLDLRWKPNVTVDYDNLPPIGRDNPRVRALFEATMRESGHRRVRKSTRSVITNYSYAGTVAPLDDYDEIPRMDDSSYFPELYEPEERVPPSDITYIMASHPPSWFNQDHKSAFFSISPTISKNLLTKATLTVFVRRPPVQDVSSLPMHISVYERYVNGTLGDKIAEKTVATHWTSDPEEIRHYELRLDENDVREWLKPAYFRQRVNENVVRTDEAFVGLYVQAVYDNANYIVYPDESGKNTMFLELEVQAVRSGRRRRSSRQAVCKPGNNETSCCLYNLMIDFEKVGWDFVIAPKRYNAYICSGDCNDTPLDPTNKHGIVTQKHKESLRCCHPKEYGSITVVYITDSQLIWVREVPGMVAKRCGCA